jgi:N-acetyl-gamma-glutamyl-phosphate reductase
MAAYGLTEFYREQIKGAKLVAGTGCNAALGQYILRPLISSNVIDFDNIILDMKCAVSGAGRALREDLLHSEASEGIRAYAVGGTHRHLGEFDQELSLLAGRTVKIQFTPHLIPANRGVLATAYLVGNSKEIYGSLCKRYSDEPFVHVLPFGKMPSTQDVRGSNHCYLGVAGDRRQDRCIVIGSLDNLTKGSSGQAIQNANLMLNEEETLGLKMAPFFP